MWLPLMIHNDIQTDVMATAKHVFSSEKTVRRVKINRTNTVGDNCCCDWQVGRKVKEADLYSAYRQYNSTTKRSDVDHTELPANTPHLLFLRISIR